MTKPAILSDIDTALQDTLPDGLLGFGDGNAISEVVAWLAEYGEPEEPLRHPVTGEPMPPAPLHTRNEWFYRGVRITRVLAEGAGVRVIPGFAKPDEQPRNELGQFMAWDAT